MTKRTRQIGGVTVTTLLYGTAWKEERTADLVAQALRRGFRGVDTANQRRHYREADVGRALQAELQRGMLRRKDVLVQANSLSGRAKITGCLMIRPRPLRARFNNLSNARCRTWG